MSDECVAGVLAAVHDDIATGTDESKAHALGLAEGLVHRLVAERDRLQAVLESPDYFWAHIAMKVMQTIDGGRRTWGDPLGDEVVAAVAEVEAERDQLRSKYHELEERYSETYAAGMGIEGDYHDAHARLDEYEHALDHVVDCPVACGECQKIARSALNHENLDDFRLAVNEALAARASERAAVDELEVVEAERDRLRAEVDVLKTVAFMAQHYLDARSLDPQSPTRTDLERALDAVRQLDTSGERT